MTGARGPGPEPQSCPCVSRPGEASAARLSPAGPQRSSRSPHISLQGTSVTGQARSGRLLRAIDAKFLPGKKCFRDHHLASAPGPGQVPFLVPGSALRAHCDCRCPALPRRCPAPPRRPRPGPRPGSLGSLGSPPDRGHATICSKKHRDHALGSPNRSDAAVIGVQSHRWCR